MPVIEHQALIHYHILSYETIIDEAQIPEMIQGIQQGVSVLDLEQCGDIIITRKGVKTEFIIPVNKKFETTNYYKYKPAFKLVNALKVRHYGRYADIFLSINEINSYITKNNLTAVTNSYFVDKDSVNSIYDVYVGISENVL